MKKNHSFLTLVLGCSLLILCGCGTVRTRSSGASGPYSGFAYDMEKLSSAEEWLTWSGEGSAGSAPFPWPRALLWLVDLPLSFTADTLLLPIELLWPHDQSNREL